jgi:hypothetical protein
MLQNLIYLDASQKISNYPPDIVDAKMKKASGIFLWVYLVLNKLRRADQHRDGYELNPGHNPQRSVRKIVA